MKHLITTLLSLMVLAFTQAQDSCLVSFDYTVDGNTVYFNNTSEIIDTSSFQGVWSFGVDNASSLSYSPTFTYPGPGVYLACLDVFGGCIGGSPLFCDTIVIEGDTILPVPEIDTCALNFSAAVNADGVLTITNNSGIGFNAENYFNWSFGDGSVSTSSWNPSHQYQQSGSYTICLQAVSCYCLGELFEYCVTVEVDLGDCPEPSIYWTTEGCENYSFQSTNQSGGTPCWYLNGELVNIGSEQYEFEFDMNGEYEVCYNLIGGPCAYEFEWCEVFMVTCINDSLDCTDPYYTYEMDDCGVFSFTGIGNNGNGTPCWYLNGDLLSIGSNSQEYSFTENGVYTICYNVLGGACNLNSEYCDTIIVDCFSDSVDCAEPIFSFSETGCNTFDFSGTNQTNGTPCWYVNGNLVNLGDNTLSYYFEENGTYEVCYNVLGGDCAFDTEYCETITINCFDDTLACDLDLSYSILDCNQLICFTNYPGVEVFWQITNANGVYEEFYSDGEAFSYTFTANGAYSITASLNSAFCEYDTLAYSFNINVDCIDNIPNILYNFALSIDAVNTDNLIIYPNPANEYFVYKGVERVEIFNNQGKRLMQSNSNRMKITKLSDGEYIVKGYIKGVFIEAKKLIVKK